MKRYFHYFQNICNPNNALETERLLNIHIAEQEPDFEESEVAGTSYPLRKRPRLHSTQNNESNSDDDDFVVSRLKFRVPKNVKRLG